MPFRKLSIRYSESARKDINDILDFTEQEWGTDQRKQYRAQLREVIHRLAEIPTLDRARDDLAAGLRSFPLGSHLICYSIQPDMLFVRRVFHSRQDASTIDWQSLSDESDENT
jgi:toxin ParE1/3/4